MNTKILLPAVILGWIVILVCTILSFIYGIPTPNPLWHFIFEPLNSAVTAGKGDAGVGAGIFLLFFSIALWVMTIFGTILLFRNSKKIIDEKKDL